MGEIWHIFLFQPLFNSLILFYRIFGNLGVSIVILTILIRVILVPLTIPSMKAAKKMTELAPEIAKLKERYKDDKQKFAQAQVELYRQHGANPVAGCLPQIVQLLILIALYQAFSNVLLPGGAVSVEKLNQNLYPFLYLPMDTRLNLSFWYLNLSKPDLIHLSGLPALPGLFLILAAVTQFLSSKMMAPAVKISKEEASKTKGEADDLAVAMQSQMLYLFPLMTILIGLTFPSGLVLYWFVFSASTMIQQYFITGWGGLEPWIEKIPFGKNGEKK